MWSCSKPSQPCREMFCTWYARDSALPKCTMKYGLVAANATADSAIPTSTRRGCRQPTSTSGTSRKTPGYLKLVAMPAARPASSIRPITSSVSETATPSVSGTSVTAMRAPAEPPRRGDRAQREHDHDDPGSEVRRVRLPRLERRDHVHQQRRVVEPVRVEPAAVRHVPGARDDAHLVRAEERERVRVG